MHGQQQVDREVRQADRCTACGACVNLCPYHALNRDQVVTLRTCDLTEGACYAFCPRTPHDVAALKQFLFGTSDLTPELGAVRAFYITRAADPEIRTRAQHGGTVTSLVRLALEERIIDSAVLTAAAHDLGGQAVTVEDHLDLSQCTGSRFVASAALAEFNRITRDGGRRVGVVATPCQALALAKIRMKPLEEYAARNWITSSDW